MFSPVGNDGAFLRSIYADMGIFYTEAIYPDMGILIRATIAWRSEHVQSGWATTK